MARTFPNQILRITLIILLSNSLVRIAVAQTYYYNIVVKSDTIGILNVSREVVKDVVKYTYSADLDFRFLTSIQIKNKMKVVYNADSLVSSTVDNIINGKEQHSSDVIIDKGKYLINTEKKKNIRFLSAINYSTILLFFKEPKGIDKVFSETNGEYMPIKQLTTGIYELTLPSGKKNTYAYKNSRLVKALINSSILGFQLILRK